MLLKMRNELATVELTTLTANTEKAVDFTERDDKIVIVVVATAETTLTVKAGNSIQGVVDLKLDIPVGTSLLKLESGRFKNVSGTNKGKIVVVSPGTPKIGVAALV